MAPHSSTLACRIPWTEEPGRLQSMGSLELDTTEQLHFHFSLSCIGEGNGNPLQCSCLENPRDGGAWWAAVSGVAQSRTRLKRHSSSRRKQICGQCVLSQSDFLSSPCSYQRCQRKGGGVDRVTVTLKILNSFSHFEKNLALNKYLQTVSSLSVIENKAEFL